jgi:hypothetical protein
MTTREELHEMIDRLPEGEALALLEDFRQAADLDGEPLDAGALASLDRGLADIAAGRVTSLDDFERNHPR